MIRRQQRLALCVKIMLEISAVAIYSKQIFEQTTRCLCCQYTADLPSIHIIKGNVLSDL